MQPLDVFEGDATRSARGGAARGLRVALFSGNYNYTRDGANQALNRLAGTLIEEGAAVRIYSPTSATPAFPPVGDVVSVPSVALPGRREYRGALPLPARVRADIEAFAPNLIHLSAPDLLGVQAQKLGRRLRLPVVASFHTHFESYLSYYRLGWLRPVVERHLRRFYARCDCVLAPTASTAQLLRGMGSAPVRLWSRGVDRQQFAPARRSCAWRRAQGLAEDDVVILFLGRLVMEKGLKLVAEAAADLACEPRVRFLVVGDGPARGWLQARLPKGVFTGALEQPELGTAVASADIMLNPSRTETFGNATLEGMASGLPVVCPTVASNLQLVQHDRQGLLIASNAADDYVAALRRLIVDGRLRARLGASGRIASASYDWRASSLAVIAAYNAMRGDTSPCLKVETASVSP